jgi:8-oxo-dGTP pyrophosphatase MutT (NUDIX family)
MYMNQYVKHAKDVNIISRNSKAGVLLYDESRGSVLLVQSRGNLWGIPKGTLELNETFPEAAVREVFEETGIKLDGVNKSKYIKIPDQDCVYYFLNYAQCDVKIQGHIEGNDANGIGWVKLECMETLILESKIKLNKHTEFAIRKFLI